MKKIIGFSSLIALLTIMVSSCGPAEVKKEVIIVPAQPQRVIIEKEPAKKSTTITLDKNGVKVESKKVDVNIKNQ
jgi:hypothetical protein